MQDLVNARLLSASGSLVGPSADPDPVMVDIIHESLLTNWGDLNQAIGKRRAALQQGARFRQALKEWNEHE